MKSQLDSISSSDWIALALKAKFKPTELAQLCGMSLRQLERYFSEAFDLPPKYWLQRLRAFAASQLIVQRKSEKEIAFTLAFSNVQHFVREFKRHYGCTPKVFSQIEHHRSEIRRRWSPEMRALEEEYQRALVHPRDEHCLLNLHRQRVQRLSPRSVL